MENLQKEYLFAKKGRVERGKRLGRRLGFPTVNITLDAAHLKGTYAGHVRVKETVLPAAVYADQERNLLEAYLFDYDGDLYGETIEVALLKKMEDPVHFENVWQLQEHITRLVREVREYLEI